MKATSLSSVYLSLIVIFFVSINSIHADEFYRKYNSGRTVLVLAGDYRCPYNCAPDDEDKGFLVELAARALYIYGIDIEYRMMPWHQALKKVDSGEIDGIFGISNIEGRNLITTNNPIEMSDRHAFTQSGIDWVFDGINSLRGKRLGITMDYMLGDALDSYFAMTFPARPQAFLIEDSEVSVIESIANLIDGDVDVFIEDRRVVNFYTNKNGLSAYVRDAGKAYRDPMPVNIALSSKLPNARKYIRYLEEGVASLKATGEYDDLREKYLMDK